ncbi:ATP-binding protein [Kordiimonas aquimaris]|uniref:ATP-binding protein n=1 Tax=Kordiimonas aquimaris TaxID=707591 RepID=UPI0021D01E91|nr:ATP-binding protein [Kordiimonas aquimaris]
MPVENPTKNTTDDISELQSEINALSQAVNALTSQLKTPDKPQLTFDNAIKQADAFVFDAVSHNLHPVTAVSAPSLNLLHGINHAKTALLENTRQFANGVGANNALLWGARGMGKSTLIKSVHRAILDEVEVKPALIEIHREDIASLPQLLRALSVVDRQCILFCDDLSFNRPDQDFKALKSVLEGGLEGRPTNILFYATSNRRHLLPRSLAEQESATGIHPNESMDETIALSDRFGLWLGFHTCDQEEYLTMIENYISNFSLQISSEWQTSALEWAKTRGNRSGRTAWQFVQNLAGKQGKSVSF